MSNLLLAAQLGLGAVVVRPKRAIGSFTAFVTTEEQHDDELEITDHPIEQGASITDHAFKRPAQVVIKCGWSNSPQRTGLIDGLVGAVTSTVDGVNSLITGNSQEQVRDIYAKLLELQASAIPFTVYTGKRTYTNMLLKRLSTTTDGKTENLLMVTAICQEILLVSTQTVTVNSDTSRQANPSSTGSTVNEGTKSLLPGTNYRGRP